MQVTKKAELYLFIIWEHARNIEQNIIQDLSSKFKIVADYQVSWSKDLFAQNLTRFYGVNLPPGSDKEQHCGQGTFRVLLVKDQEPDYDIRQTSKGSSWVNTKVFDSKMLYRYWSGGGHRVHGTNTPQETEHDIALLFGRNIQDFLEDVQQGKRKSVGKINKDLEGALGWRDLQHFFYILNASCNYTILRNFEYLPKKYNSTEHGDIDLLVYDHLQTACIANAQKVFPEDYRVHYVTQIKKQNVFFDFRSVHDMYYDPSWATQILNKREFSSKGFFVPNSSDYFYSLLYHAVWHKPFLSEDYIQKLTKLAKQQNISLTKKNFQNPAYLRNILVSYLFTKGYDFTIPIDHSVYINYPLLVPISVINPSINQQERGTFYTNFNLKQRDLCAFKPAVEKSSLNYHQELESKIFNLEERLKVITDSKLYRHIWPLYEKIKKTFL